VNSATIPCSLRAGSWAPAIACRAPFVMPGSRRQEPSAPCVQDRGTIVDTVSRGGYKPHMRVKVACLGGGSLYFPRAIGDLVKRRDLEGSSVALYDLDARKAGLMARLGRRLAREAGTRFSFTAPADLAEALDGADVAISSIGGSGAEISPDVYGSSFHAADMYIPARYGIHQVVGDTAGPAGMMMGLRSVPACLAICREMEKRCPDAVLFSHSNPMAVLCRAMRKHSRIQAVGICHGVQETVQQAASMLEVPAEELECTWVGTNHCYWILRAVHRGRDLTKELQNAADRLGTMGSASMCHRLSRVHGCKMGYPGAGHLAEFHSWGSRLVNGRLPYGLEAEAREHGFDETRPMPRRLRATPEVRRAFLEKYARKLDAVHLARRADYASAEGIASMISAIAHGRREVFIVNLPNRGVFPNLSADAIVEIEGVTDSAGVRGITVGDCPPAIKGILEKRFAWQELVVDAAVTGDRRVALQSLMLDETAIPPDDAERMLEELLEASRDMLPRFFKPGRSHHTSGRSRQRTFRAYSSYSGRPALSSASSIRVLSTRHSAPAVTGTIAQNDPSASGRAAYLRR